jgi:8-oxo-dGTP pyrophosphatase MutT (NUDIX family)
MSNMPDLRGLPPSLERLAQRLGGAADVPTGRPAAVLVLLTVTEGRAEVLLIRRPTHLRHHAGQMACPGGSRETGDATLWETALREAEEEVAVDPAAVTRVGALPPVDIRVSGFTVVPWVAWTPARPPLTPAVAEVAEILWVPLDVLRRVYRRAWRQRGDLRFETPEFSLPQGVVWGATGRMLEQLFERFPVEEQRMLEREAGPWN